MTVRTLTLANRSALVLGLGLTGLSMARWLKARGAKVRVADTRDTPPQLGALRAELPQVEAQCGAFTSNTFDGVDLIAVSPGLPLADPIIRAGTQREGMTTLGDIELFAVGLAQMCAQRGIARPSVLAITGSNGKSTVTEMTGALCRAAGKETLVAGNIGLPVLDALLEIEKGIRPFPEAVVLEISSFQLELTETLQPDAAVVLNLSEDHLDRYPGMQEYAAAKARIYVGAGVQIFNRDDDWTRRMTHDGAPLWSFGLRDTEQPHAWGLTRDESQTTWLSEGRQPIMPTTQLKVAGLHNAANALASLALARAIGLPYEKLRQGLARFRGLPHRVEYVAEIAGRRFFDDSKGTNVGATVAALKGMSDPVVLIAGGDGKGQDFRPLAPAVADHARAVVLIGRDRELIANAIERTGVKLHRATDMIDAVQRAFDAAQSGDIVMLSPACASFDMFDNYEHRAQVFREAVAKLEGVSRVL